MYTPFHAIENDGQLWRIPRCACPIENKDGKIFTMQDKGLAYICTIRQQGDVTVRQDTVQNISSSPITFQAYSPKLDLPGGDYQVYTQLNGQLVEGEEPRAAVNLSNVVKDPGERINLADEMPELAAEMKTLYTVFSDWLGSWEM